MSGEKPSAYPLNLKTSWLYFPSSFDLLSLQNHFGQPKTLRERLAAWSSKSSNHSRPFLLSLWPRKKLFPWSVSCSEGNLPFGLEEKRLSFLSHPWATRLLPLSLSLFYSIFIEALRGFLFSSWIKNSCQVQCLHCTESARRSLRPNHPRRASASFLDPYTLLKRSQSDTH